MWKGTLKGTSPSPWIWGKTCPLNVLLCWDGGLDGAGGVHVAVLLRGHGGSQAIDCERRCDTVDGFSVSQDETVCCLETQQIIDS